MKKALFSTLIIAVAVGGYTLYRVKDLWRGPALQVTAPTNQSAVTAPLVQVTGRVARIDHLQLNGGKIFANQDGRFSESLLLFPGYNIIKLEAEDRFGRKVTQSLELVYQKTL